MLFAVLMSAAASTAALAAPAHPWPPAPKLADAVKGEIRGAGTEPFWGIEINGKTITLKGSHPEPGGGKMSHRAVWHIADSNATTFEMYGTHGHGGKEMKFLEILYTRKP